MYGFDADKWAEAWMELVKETPEDTISIATDKDTMRSWFANAIMAGYDHAFQQEVDIENDMSTPIKRALHYLECYALHWPDSGVIEVMKELQEKYEETDGPNL